MHDVSRVGGGQHVEQLIREQRHLEGWQRAIAIQPRSERLPLQQLHHQERRAVLGDVVVEHFDRPGVHHLVADVTLTQETRSDVLAHRHFGMQHLDSHPAAIAMGGRVDGRHAPDADHGI
jgi:hypothetical protein